MLYNWLLRLLMRLLLPLLSFSSADAGRHLLFFHLAWRISFSISCRIGLQATNFLSLFIWRSSFLFHFWRVVPLGIEILVGHFILLALWMRLPLPSGLHDSRSEISSESYLEFCTCWVSSPSCLQDSALGFLQFGYSMSQWGSWGSLRFLDVCETYWTYMKHIFLCFIKSAAFLAIIISDILSAPFSALLLGFT